MDDKPAPIIVIKRSAKHGGHHGGAWKVAYADFVTAMMALFIVLWLLNSSKQIQEAVGGYFKDPSGNSKMVGSNQRGSGQNLMVSKENMAQLKEQLQNAIREVSNLDQFKDQIKMTITAEGLRIELLESAAGTFFDSGSAALNASGKELLVMLAQQLGTIPNQITIEGHTDSKPFAGAGDYSNWELSTDRANAARRLMQQSGLRENQVTQVRGYADQQLRKKDDPLDPSNRRISVVVRYLDKDKAEHAPEAGNNNGDKAEKSVDEKGLPPDSSGGQPQENKTQEKAANLPSK